jgi:serine/threonine protein kinase/tetratricopeptide (TPR) repeat protein
MPGLATTHFHGTERFELISLVGRGAHGIVYEAFDHECGASVALKVLAEPSPAEIAAFKNEFRALQEIRHPHLVELKELLFERGHWLLAMQLVRGIDILSFIGGKTASCEGSGPRIRHAAPADDDTIREWAPPLAEERPAAIASGAFSEQRLRSSFEQLACGLMALHAANRIHRDLKRSNVLVDAEGRVTILDFGLVASFDSVGSVMQETLLGTPSTMAPEQAALGRVGPASDWYSVGAMLYQALTGRAPFVGSRADVLNAKLRSLPPAPAEIVASVPPDLSKLSMELLAIEPQRRPLGQSVLTRILARRPAELGPRETFGRGSDSIFVGRTAELEALHEALDRVRNGTSFTVVVEGESGVGKTSLVHRFLRQIQARGAPVALFTGRCFERESLPFKALDGVVDSMCSHLSRLSRAEVAALLPADVRVVAQAFPALRQLQDAPVSAAEHEAFDPHTQRLRVFAALRELFKRLAKRSLSIVVIDDMQWSDVDSLAVLSALLQPPDAPAMLWIAIQRPGASLSRAPLPGESTRLALGPLSTQESGALVTELLALTDTARAPREIRGMISEACGHPLFLREIARHAVVTDRGAAPRLDDALWQRINALDPATRQLLVLTAVAGQPTAQGAVADALLAAPAGRAAEDSAQGYPSNLAKISDQISELRHASLICTTGSHPNDTIEPYHDRIRETVLNHLDVSERQRSHLLLAGALERSETRDAEALAHHFQQGGACELAYGYSVAAAEQAASALAFDRAARLYRRSLDLAAPASAEIGELRRKLGDALANAGRGLEAAQAYQAAANPNTLEGVLLERLAAEQLLRSGHVKQGISSVSRVLRKMGVTSPKNRLLAVLSLVFLRARIRLRGFRHRQRHEREIPPLQLMRIDGAWTAATCLTMFDGVRSAELQCRTTLLALRAGTPLQVLRAHTAEAMFLALAGQSGKLRIERLLGSASKLASELRHPSAQAWVALSRGASAFFLGEWAEGENECGHAEEIFHGRPGASFELASARAFLVWSAMMQGRFARVLKLVPAYVAEAENRGDLYAATYQMTGFSNVAWLSMDDVAEARRMLAVAESRWPTEQFDVPRYLNMIAGAHIELYDQQGRTGYERILRDWRSLRWGVAFRAQITRFGMRFVRGLCALAAFDELGERALLRDAHACAQAIARERVTWSECFSQILLFGIAMRRGLAESALIHLEQAEERARLTGMALHGAVVRHRRGEIIGGHEGQALIDEALVFTAAQDIKNPQRMLDMLSPKIPTRT